MHANKRVTVGQGVIEGYPDKRRKCRTLDVKLRPCYAQSVIIQLNGNSFTNEN